MKRLKLIFVGKKLLSCIFHLCKLTSIDEIHSSSVISISIASLIFQHYCLLQKLKNYIMTVKTVSKKGYCPITLAIYSCTQKCITGICHAQAIQRVTKGILPGFDTLRWHHQEVGCGGGGGEVKNHSYSVCPETHFGFGIFEMR